VTVDTGHAMRCVISTHGTPVNMFFPIEQNPECRYLPPGELWPVPPSVDISDRLTFSDWQNPATVVIELMNPASLRTAISAITVPLAGAACVNRFLGRRRYTRKVPINRRWALHPSPVLTAR
jgi:hypothetical protein